MKYILRQLLPLGSNDEAIEIHLEEDEVCVGSRSKILSKYCLMSADHALFFKSDCGALFVKDASKYGIFVNNVRIGRSLKRLTVGDVIGFGVPGRQSDKCFICTVCHNVQHEVIEILDNDNEDNVPPNNDVNHLISREFDDVTGFGVASSQKAEGFVCAAYSDAVYKVQHEVIVISDDDDDDPPRTHVKNPPILHTSQSVKGNRSSVKFPVLNVVAACTSNSLTASQNSISESKNSLIANFWSGSESSSMNDNESRRKSSNATCAIPIVSNVKHDTVKNPQFFNLPSTSKQKATPRKPISSLKRHFPQNSRTSSDTASSDDVKCDGRKRQKMSAVSKSQNIPAVSHHMNEKFQDVFERTPTMFVSKNFLCTNDVENTFSESYNSSSSWNIHRYVKERSQTSNKSFNLSSKKCNSVIKTYIDSKNEANNEMELLSQRKCTSLSFETAKSKPSSEINAKDNELNCTSYNVISYSQVEDIIYLSDEDEDQDYVHMNQEPKDIKNHHEIDVGEGNKLNDIVNIMDDFVVIKQKKNEKETSESVPAFVERTQVDKMKIEAFKHESDSESTNENCYSQDIYVSDDDEYFDFKSSHNSYNKENEINENVMKNVACVVNINNYPCETVSCSKNKYRRIFNNYLTSFELRNRLVFEILNLSPKWLEQQEKIKHPPNPVSLGACNLPLKFDSFQSYVTAFYPMIMLEIWEQMYTESKKVFEKRKPCKNFLFYITSYIIMDDYVELECESVVFDNVWFAPREGSIVILDMKKSDVRRYCPMFAYIHKCRTSELYLKNLKYPCWEKVFKRNGIKDTMNNANHIIFFAHIRKKEMTFKLHSLMKGRGLCYIRNTLRQADALTHLQNSPLLDDFLQPNWQTFHLKSNTVGASVGEYNSGQMELISGVSAEFCKPTDESKIMLLQGPPGTGKTHTIIGLIQKLLINNSYRPSFKILIAAPSNAAIDEIACRLIAFNENAKFEDCIQFARVGQEDQVHPKVKPYLIENMVENLAGNSLCEGSNQNDTQLLNLQAEIIKLQNQTPAKDTNEKLSHLQEQYNHMRNCATINRFRNPSEELEDILEDCHIILSTLSSSSISLLLRTFRPLSPNQISCCIIDESTQCTELEILQPLMLGVRKLLLVGDHKQLPATVLSRLACRCGFERSAFERFHLYFEKYYKKTPMFTLIEQFRMHSTICEFPSNFFYDQKLITNPNVNVKYEGFPLPPCIYLDIFSSRENGHSSSKKNSTEAEVIINICTSLLNLDQSASSIGIITPYHAQRSLVETALVKAHLRGIEVNTVDGFQGREKDIIIMSSVRANSQGNIGFLACSQRLNVAITRAKKCLIMCTHMDTLASNLSWRKLFDDGRKRGFCFQINSPLNVLKLFQELKK